MPLTHQMPLSYNDEIKKPLCEKLVLEYSDKPPDSDLNREENLTICKLKNISLSDKPVNINSEENVEESPSTISNQTVVIEPYPTLDDDSNSPSPLGDQYKNADLIPPASPSPTTTYRTNLLKDTFIYYGPKSEKCRASAHQRRQEQIREYYIATKSSKVSKKTPSTPTRVRSSSLNSSQIPSPTFNQDTTSSVTPSSASLQNSFASQQSKKKRTVRFNV